MAVAWCFAPYVTVDTGRGPGRRLAMDEYSDAISADGGSWSEIEVIGNQAIVKVSANAGTLNTIGQDSRFHRIPRATALNTPLSDLTTPQRNALRTKILSLGITAAEFDAEFPNPGSVTLRQVLVFVLKHNRIAPRWDATSGWVFDGRVFPCKRLEDVDAEALG